MEKDLPWYEKLKLERIRHNWSQDDVADKVGCDTKTVGRWERGESFPRAYHRQKLVDLYGKSTEELGLIVEHMDAVNWPQQRLSRQEDWGEALDIENFYGREKELSVIKTWIKSDHCRLIAVLGIGGVGKTTFSAIAAQSVKDTFDYVFWRSLRNAPIVESILESFIYFISQQRMNLPLDVEGQISILIDFLRDRSCLLILDNVESILQAGHRAGIYRENYEGYGRLFQRIGEVSHRSCLLLTSREKTQEIAYMEGSTSATRTLLLSGIGHQDGKELLRDRGIFGTDTDWVRFVNLYGGNPLALKLVAEPIHEVFRGDIADFISQEEIVFGDIQDLLNQQFLRLSQLEINIICWMAIERESISLNQLRSNMLGFVSKGALLEALDSLRRRSLIEISSEGNFFLQPVIEEFLTKRFVEDIYEEIVTERPDYLSSHALIRAQSSDYVRNSQIRQILAPLASKLLTIIGKAESEKKLKRLISMLHSSEHLQSGYAAGNILNLLIQLQTDLRGFDFSDLAVRQAYLQEVALPEVNFAHSDLSTSVFSDAFSNILCLATSSNGELLAAGTTTNEVRLWSQNDARALFTCIGHSDGIRSVAFSPDCKLLASASEDQTVRLWDTSTGNCIKVLYGHTNMVRSVVFSPNGHFIASASEDMTIRFWELETGDCIKILQGHASRIRSIAFHPEGSIFASCSDDETIRLWDTLTGNCLHILRGHSGMVRSVSFSPAGEILASGGEDSTVRLWNGQSGECSHVLKGHLHRVWTVAFSTDNLLLASSGDDQTIRIWDTHSGENVRTLQGHTNRVWSVVFVPGSNVLISSSEDDTIRFWETQIGQCIRTLLGRSNLIKSLAFSRDGKILASGSEDQKIRLWDSHTGSCVRTLQGHLNRIRSVSFSPSGKVLASGSEDESVRIWDIESGRCLKILQGHTHLVRSVAFNWSNGRLVSASHDLTVREWNSETGVCMRVIQMPSVVWNISFSLNGKVFATSHDDHCVRVWDAKKGKCIRVLAGHTHRVWGVAFSPDGSLLASCGDDQTIHIWNVHSGLCLKTLQGHTSWIRSIAFSPNGLQIASGSHDRTVRIWDINTYECSQILAGHSNAVWSVIFNPINGTLASGGDDGDIRIWDVNTGKCLKTINNEMFYENMIIAHARGLSDAQKISLKMLGAVELDV